MERTKLDMILTHFQARARGYLVRNEVCRAQEDFEDIVREIDGGLDHLKWLKKTLCFPHFTDTQGSAPQRRSPVSNFQNSEPDPSDLCESPVPADYGLNREVNGGVLSEKLEAERDSPKTKASASESGDCFENSLQRVNEETQKKGNVPNKEKDGGMMESTCDSTTVWSSVDTDMDSSRSVKGLRQYCLARNVPRTPEALRVHRNTLSMELVWIQQAIDSRKKYLSLKNKLTVS